MQFFRQPRSQSVLGSATHPDCTEVKSVTRDVSVVLATYNRAPLLRDTLGAFEQQRCPNISWEVVPDADSSLHKVILRSEN